MGTLQSKESLLYAKNAESSSASNKRTTSRRWWDAASNWCPIDASWTKRDLDS